jgi:hypothetical protein
MSDAFFDPPKPFIKLRLEDISKIPNLYAYCVGYEGGKWRDEQLAFHVMEWLPEYSLKYSELKNLEPGNSVRIIRQAARSVYLSDNFSRRGEFGEILLHILIRQTKKTIPAISKIYFKDAWNDTIKGFDCVHIVVSEAIFELWLGEVKFYSDINDAISDVCQELIEHTKQDYLKNEFSAIVNKLDPVWPYTNRLKDLLDMNTSLDQIFECVCIPVLLTYNSKTVKSFSQICTEYEQQFNLEVTKNYEKFVNKMRQLPIVVHLFLLPLEDKDRLNQILNDKLKGFQ